MVRSNDHMNVDTRLTYGSSGLICIVLLSVFVWCDRSDGISNGLREPELQIYMYDTRSLLSLIYHRARGVYTYVVARERLLKRLPIDHW